MESADDAELREIAALLSERLAPLSDRIAETIRREVDFYAATDLVSHDQIAETTDRIFGFLVPGVIGHRDFDTSAARAMGAHRAELGVPLPAVLHAYRIAFQMLWREFREVAVVRTDLSREALLEATSRMWDAYDRFSEAMTAAHRERTVAQALDDATERAALTEHLLQGRVSSEQTLWEIAELLRIPTRGPYVAVAAAVGEIGSQPLPRIESILRASDIYSAWRLLPDQLIGIVATSSSYQVERLLGVLRERASGRVGVSSPFADLTDSARALRYARIALTRPGGAVEVFDDSVLGVAAAHSPEVSTDLARSVLAGLYRLPQADRELLFDTFGVWVSLDGNVNATAEQMHVHRNTVRHRLQRITELTGRSTSAPRDLAELCLAFEVEAHFPHAD
ncbi:MAG: helix-turn-helix domain-containing protein [Gordonia sp. (in: high G+C Gram-positive bacteria)]|uniref:PucR family transcriptional regulator n=1 Tax=Gordonia sp. (in: high G+C Gram-positive bacteria) TaxID=84139 RepID=UPI0039E521FB